MITNSLHVCFYSISSLSDVDQKFNFLTDSSLFYYTTKVTTFEEKTILRLLHTRTVKLDIQESETIILPCVRMSRFFVLVVTFIIHWQHEHTYIRP